MAGRIRQTDVIVLGSGIAGLSVADALMNLRKSCVVLDIHPQGSGASAAPAMLVNPATGKRAKKSWNAAPGFQAVSGLLQRVATHTNENFYELKGVARPALTRKMALHFRRSPQKYKWEDGWLTWMNQEAFSTAFPAIGENYGGLFIRKAGTVNGRLFNRAWIRYLEDHGVLFRFGQKTHISKKGDSWVVTAGDTLFSSPILIDATGSAQVSSDWWNHIPLHPVKGQAATLTFSEPLPLKCSVSGMGYLAWLSDNPAKVTVGSTYEHHFQNTEPDQAGEDALREKLNRLLPEFSNKVVSSKRWAGVRVTLPDRYPVTGPHPGHKNLFIIGALGSRGLLTGRYLAGLLTHHIFLGSEIPDNVSVQRF